jgi:hypothetical protein
MKAPRLYKVMHLLTVFLLAAGMAFGEPTHYPDDGSIFVNVLIPKRELYVGESVPVVVQVGAQDDVVASLDSPPSLRGDAFILNVLSGEPEREQRVINGKPCTVLAWHSLLAAVKPGTLSLTLEAPLTVRVPAPRQAEANYADESTGDPYSDPAFQSLLQTTTAQSIIASSQPVTFKVLQLPAENRPAGFSGAVGRFEITSELSKSRAIVGEPLTLRMRVLGTGNFDRVSSAMLGSSEVWKSHRPTASFTPGAGTGFQGEKLFEQAVIATRPGTRDLPPLEFSYFDPETRRYETARTAPLSVEVVQGPASATPLAARTSPTDAAQHSAAGLIAPPVRGDHPARDGTTDTLVPLYLQPRFLTVPVLLILAFGGMWFRRIHRDTGGSPAPGASPQASAQDLLRQMELAATSGDVAKFFHFASRVLRHAGMIDHDAEAREILQLVDEANYAGEMPRSADLQLCRRVVLRCLATRSAS